jgi:hypothetical protein
MLSLDLKPHIIADDEFTNMLLDQHILSFQKLGRNHEQKYKKFK